MITNFDLYALPPLISAIGNLLLGGIVVWKKPKSQLHKAWGLLSLCCAIWSFGFFMVYANKFDKQAALFWNHFYSVVMVMIPTAYFYYILVLTETKKKSLWAIWWFTFSIAALVTPTISTQLFNKSLVLQYWGFSPIRGLTGTIYDVTYPIIVIIGTYVLVVSLRDSTGRKNLQIKYGILAACIGFTFGLTNFFPLYGFNIYPLGHVGNLVANLIIAYSIMRYTFMDIDIIIKKGLVYSVVTSVLAGFYVSIIFLSQETLRIININNAMRIPATLFAIVLIAVVFEPLRSMIQRFVDKRFFKTQYDYREAIKEFSRMVVTILDLDMLLHKTAETIKSTLQLDQVVVFLRDEETKDFEVAAFAGGDESIIAGWSFDEHDQLLQKLTETTRNVVLENEEGGGQAVISLWINNEVQGLLVLGEKLSGDVYTPNDMDLLSTLADQLSIAVENARLYRAAVTDKVSRLFNGAYFYDRLEEELARSKGHGTSLGILMLDIDGFGGICEREGALVEDYIIMSIGKGIKSEIRPYDIAARVGDDEFAIMLPGIQREELYFWESKIQESAARLKINGETGLVSVSGGFAYTENGLKTSKRLIN
jgi:diguanylate cyclase (GGDEF)-like protein